MLLLFLEGMQELIFDEMPKLKENSKRIEASVGLSREWDARKAGIEVAKSCLNKLSTPPNFILLFSTIHYKYHGGFEKFLEGVWKVVPKGTPLIGGTVAGFINNEGCFSRGATALAVSYPNMDVAVSYGRYTKRHPNKAANKCASDIKMKLKNSRYSNKTLINMISGPIVPESLSGVRVNVIKSKFLGSIIAHIGLKMYSYRGYGFAKEAEILETLVKSLSDFNIIGGSTVDEGKILYNYQFIGNKFYDDAIVGLGISIDLPSILKGKIGLHDTNKTFKITKTTCNKYVITKINKKSAKHQFFKLLGLPEEQFKELEPFYYKTSDYFPFSFEENRNCVLGIAAILGDNLVVSHKLGGNNARLLSVDGKEIISSFKQVFTDFSDISYPFVLCFSSAIYPFILGRKTFDIKEILTDTLENTPFLVLFPQVENICIKNNKPSVRVYSTNILTFSKNLRGVENRV